MQITQLLQQLQGGDRDAMHAVIPLVYEELKKLARSHLRREMKAVPLQTTALVHEAFLKLAGGRHPSYENRTHFYGVASRLMRQVLVDTARARSSEKRASGQEVARPTYPSWGRSRIDRYWRWTTRCSALKKRSAEGATYRHAVFRRHDCGRVLDGIVHPCTHGPPGTPPGPSLAAERDGRRYLLRSAPLSSVFSLVPQV